MARSFLLIALGMFLMYIVLKILSSKTVDNSQTSQAVINTLKTQQAANLIRTNEFRELVNTPQFKGMVKTLATKELKALSNAMML